MIKHVLFLLLAVFSFGALAQEASLNATLNFVEYPVTSSEGNSRGLENGHCHVTFQKIGDNLAVTVAFNTADVLTKAMSSVLTKSKNLPLANGAVTHDLAIPQRTLYYEPGLMILSDGEHLEDQGEITDFDIRADRNLENIESVRVRFFEDVNRKGRNQTGSVVCSPAAS